MAKEKVIKEGHSGVGIVLTNGLCGIDIDSHNSEINKYASDILDMFKETYIEKSPSGNGYHILFMCDCSKLPIVKDANGNALRDKNGKYLLDGYSLRNDSIGIEFYPSEITNRYFTFTENRINNNDIEDMTEKANEFLKLYMDDEQKELPKHSDKEIILNKARNATNGSKFVSLYDKGDISAYCNDDSRADLALCSMLAY